MIPALRRNGDLPAKSRIEAVDELSFSLVAGVAWAIVLKATIGARRYFGDASVEYALQARERTQGEREDQPAQTTPLSLGYLDFGG